MGSELFDLTGKVALITGATQGLVLRSRAAWRKPGPGLSSTLGMQRSSSEPWRSSPKRDCRFPAVASI